MNPFDSSGLNNRPQEVAEELRAILGGLLRVVLEKTHFIRCNHRKSKRERAFCLFCSAVTVKFPY